MMPSQLEISIKNAAELIKMISSEKSKPLFLEESAKAHSSPYSDRAHKLIDSYLILVKSSDEPLTYVFVADALRKIGKEIEESEFEKFVKGEDQEILEKYFAGRDWGFQTEEVKERYVKYLAQRMCKKAKKEENWIIRFYLARVAVELNKQQGLSQTLHDKLMEVLDSIENETIEPDKLQKLAESYLQTIEILKQIEEIKKQIS